MCTFKGIGKVDQNFTNICVTKYNSDEIGGFQVSTGSGSYTLGPKNMHSKQAQTYFDTCKTWPRLQFLKTVLKNQKKSLFSFMGMMADCTILNSTFFNILPHVHERIIPFVIENYESFPDNQKKNISHMHHVFCGLYILLNLGIYGEKTTLEFDQVVKE